MDIINQLKNFAEENRKEMSVNVYQGIWNMIQGIEHDLKEELIEEIVEEFFKRRFPDKDLKFEKECGYFGEWVMRFKGGSPESYSDDTSLSVLQEMKSEGIKW